MKAFFPRQNRQRYWNLHYKYVLNSLRAAGFEIVFQSGRDLDTVRFRLGIFGKEIIIDFRDFFDVDPIVETGIPYFKFHRNPELKAKYSNLHPLGPVSADNWTVYEEIRRTGEYKATGNNIMNNQRAYGDAIQRRRKVRSMLSQTFHGRMDFQIHRQPEFWKKGMNCLVSVCVPGARNDILDRGQVQFMGLGICTISPQLICELPYGKVPEPGVHYLECSPNYGDLSEKIRWCEENRERCVEIGRNSKALFEACCLPERKWAYVREVIAPG